MKSLFSWRIYKQKLWILLDLQFLLLFPHLWSLRDTICHFKSIIIMYMVKKINLLWINFRCYRFWLLALESMHWHNLVFIQLVLEVGCFVLSDCWLHFPSLYQIVSLTVKWKQKPLVEWILIDFACILSNILSSCSFSEVNQYKVIEMFTQFWNVV